MENQKKKFLLGICVAPLFAPIVFTLILILIGASNQKGPICNGASLLGCLDGFFIVFFLGAPIAYFVAIIFGVPIYMLVRRLGFLNFWSLSIGGGLAASIPLVLIYGLNAVLGDIEYIRDKDLNVFYIIFICGVVVGTIFWAITLRGNRNHFVND